MRLIDGDALIELINGGYDLDFDEVPETKRELLRMIMEQPTADAVPVRHEHWEHLKHYPNLLFCSGCGDPQAKDIARFYHYCPTCGARMDEDD